MLVRTCAFLRSPTAGLDHVIYPTGVYEIQIGCNDAPSPAEHCHPRKVYFIQPDQRDPAISSRLENISSVFQK
jgi:hypothetical protein